MINNIIEELWEIREKIIDLDIAFITDYSREQAVIDIEDAITQLQDNND